MPAVAVGKVVVVMVGGGLTLTCTVADFVASVIEVAVTVAVNTVVTEAGALYVTEVVVWALSVPPPETPHWTPALFASPVTVAVMESV
jgi:glycerol kinase